MNQWNLQQNAYVASEEMRGSVSLFDLKDPVIYPKPRRVGVLSNNPMRLWRLHASHQAEVCDSKAGAELLDIILMKIREGRNQILPERMKKEFKLTMNTLRTTISGDVYEGIRALIIDKDNAPKDQAVLDEQQRVDLCRNVKLKTVKGKQDSELPKTRSVHCKNQTSIGRSKFKHNLTEVEKEEWKICRILANRESARQTIRRRQIVRFVLRGGLWQGAICSRKCYASQEAKCCSFPP